MKQLTPEHQVNIRCVRGIETLLSQQARGFFLQDYKQIFRTGTGLRAGLKKMARFCNSERKRFSSHSAVCPRQHLPCRDYVGMSRILLSRKNDPRTSGATRAAPYGAGPFYCRHPTLKALEVRRHIIFRNYLALYPPSV